MPTTTRRPIVPILALASVALLVAGSHAAATDQPPPEPVPPPAGEPPVSEPAPPATAAPAESPGDEAALFARAGRILQGHCAMPGCHLGPGAREGLRLESGEVYRTTVNVRARSDSRLLRLVPGAPERSLLYLKLLSPSEGHYRGPRMPLAMDALTPEQIAAVRDWIASFPPDLWGAPPAASATVETGRTFRDTALTYLPTTEPLGDNTLEFRILHAFKSSAREAGSHDFYGLDTGAWISFSLAYGLTPRLDLGLRRTNFEHDVEAFGKWTPVTQTYGGAPLSLSLRGSVASLRDQTAFNRTRYGAQLAVARRFGGHLSLMLVPTYVTHTNYLSDTDDRATSALGVGAEVHLNGRMSINGEWISQGSGVSNDYESASIGFSIATARHVFQIFATNTAGAHTDLYAPGGDLTFADGQFRLGFNVSRTFTPRAP